MRSLLSAVLGTTTVAVGTIVVALATLTSTPQDWEGNASEPDVGRVAVVCFLLAGNIGLSVLTTILIRRVQGRKGTRPSPLMIVVLLSLVSSMLLGALKWFPLYAG